MIKISKPLRKLNEAHVNLLKRFWTPFFEVNVLSSPNFSLCKRRAASHAFEANWNSNGRDSLWSVTDFSFWNWSELRKIKPRHCKPCFLAEGNFASRFWEICENTGIWCDLSSRTTDSSTFLGSEWHEKASHSGFLYNVTNCIFFFFCNSSPEPRIINEGDRGSKQKKTTSQLNFIKS